MKSKIIYIPILILLLSCSERKLVEDQSILSHIPKIDVLINNQAFDGYIFLRRIKSPGVQFMINNNGEVVWAQMSDTTLLRVFTPYKESYLALYSKEEIHDITYTGDTLLSLKYGTNGFDKKLHHEVIKDGRDIIGITHEVIPIDLSEYNGQEIDTIKTDGIVRLSSTGEKLWSWSLEDEMNPLAYPKIASYKHDWGHANALAIDTDGHYLISWRDFNQVWKINRNNGDVIWKYGGDKILNAIDRFYGQHSITINFDGEYMVFDNGDASIRRTSRATIFEQNSDSLLSSYSIELPDSLFTVKQGSVYQFDEDRFLFCSTMRKSLVVTNRKGEILWLAKTDEEFYRAYYLDNAILD